MSGFGPDFRAHLQGDCTTLCHCWKLVRRDGIVLGFTDHDLPLEIDGTAYEPQSGFSQSEVRSSLGMAVDSADVEGALTSERLTDGDVALGLFDGATVETLMANWRESTQFATLRRASIARISRRDGRFIAELESLAASLDKPNGRVLRRDCDARLGDGRCKVNLEADGYHGSGSVVALSAPTNVHVSGLGGFAEGWFAHGELTWTSGLLEGRTVTVLAHRNVGDETVLTLSPSEPLPSPDDSFEIVAGCDKSFATCKAKFSNPENFRGFPHLPGNDSAYAYVVDGLLFDGGALVK
jgi:uncharacterized phage protein (TIGR02218 family)